MYKTLDAPLSAHVEINADCNQKCVHCYNFWRADSPWLRERLTMNMAERIANELGRLKVFHAILNGGEPMLNFGVLTRLMARLSDEGVSFTLNSNLTIVDPAKALRLRELGLRSVLTSMMSFDPKLHDRLANSKGAHARLLKGFAICRDAGLRVSVNMVVSKANLDQVRATGDFARSLGAKAFSATRVMNPRSPGAPRNSDFELERGDVRLIVEQLTELSREGLKIDSLIPYPACFLRSGEERSLFGGRSCSAGKTAVAIGYDGKVRTCTHHEESYGSLMREDLDVIWLRMQSWRNGEHLPKMCLECKYLSSCGGGCRVASCSGDICGKDAMAEDEAPDSLPELPVSDQPTIEGMTRLRVRKNCRFRKDAVFGIVNTEGAMNTFVTPAMYDLVQSLHDSGSDFTPDEVAGSRNLSIEPAKLRMLMSELVRRKVLEKVPVL